MTAGQITKLLKRDIVIYPSDGKDLKNPDVYRVADSEGCELVTANEKAVAEWVLRNNKHAGAATDTLANAKCQYLAICQGNRVYGVVGIHMDEIPLDAFENSVMLSIMGECALALENMKNAREKEDATVLAKNEQLRANLLRAISHDLRTPLTSISGSAGNLMANYQKMDNAMRVQTFTDIYDDSMWLINLVDNAIKYTPAGSVIEISMKKEGEWIYVSVSDNGPGIPDEQKTHIFDMFYSGANKIADSRRSLGLGLSLCKSIVTAHGGVITVSDNQPKGTVFIFTLPAGEVNLNE